MKILVVGIDSDIGYEIAEMHKDAGDEVTSTSRNDKKPASLHFEMVNRLSWPKFPIVDKLYFTIGTGDGRLSRNEVMNVNAFLPLDFFRYVLNNNICNNLVILSSRWGSISNTESQRAIYYRMSKAALNMGVVAISKQFPTAKLTLVHPGLVKTKMTTNLRNAHTQPMMEPAESAFGIYSHTKSNPVGCRFIDYQGYPVAW